jgi:hypothetical protein
MKNKILALAGLLLVLVSGVSAQLSEDWRVQNSGFQYSNVYNGWIGQSIGDTNYIRYPENGSVFSSSTGFQYSRGITPTDNGGMLWHYDVSKLRNSSDLKFDSGDSVISSNSGSRTLRNFDDNGKMRAVSLDQFANLVEVYNGERKLLKSISVSNQPSQAVSNPNTGAVAYSSDGALYVLDSNNNQIYSDTDNTGQSTSAFASGSNSFYVEDEKIYVGQYGPNTSTLSVDVINSSSGNLIKNIEWTDPGAEQYRHVPKSIEKVGSNLYYIIETGFGGPAYLKGLDLDTKNIFYSSQGTISWNDGFSSVEQYKKSLIVDNDPYLARLNLPNNPPNVTINLNPNSPGLNDVVDVSLNASDPDKDAVDTIEASVYRDGKLLNSSTFSGDSVDFNGFFTVSEFASYNVTVKATDEFGAEKTKSTTFEVVDQPPVFEENFTDPKTLSFGDEVDVFANVTDQTSVIEVTGDVTEDGNFIINNESLTENTEGLWEGLQLYTADQRNSWYNTTLNATDENGKTSSVEINRYLDDLNPEIETYDFSPSADEWINGTSPDLFVRASDDLGVENVTATAFKNGTEIVSETGLNKIASERWNINDFFKVDAVGKNYSVEIRVYDSDSFVSTTETQYITSKYPRLSSITYEGTVDVRGSETPNLFVEAVFSLSLGVVLIIILLAMF